MNVIKFGVLKNLKKQFKKQKIQNYLGSVEFIKATLIAMSSVESHDSQPFADCENLSSYHLFTKNSCPLICTGNLEISPLFGEILAVKIQYPATICNCQFVCRNSVCYFLTRGNVCSFSNACVHMHVFLSLRRSLFLTAKVSKPKSG